MKQPLDHLRSQKKPVSKTVWIPLDSDLADEYNAAEDRLAEAQRASDQAPKEKHLKDRVVDAEEEVERLRSELRTASAKFVAKSLGRTAFDELEKQHLPTKEQQADAKKDGLGSLSWNPDTFPPALIQACVFYVTPDDDDPTQEVYTALDELFVKELWEGGDDAQWNHSEVMRIFAAAMEANQTYRVVDLGNGSRRTRG